MKFKVFLMLGIVLPMPIMAQSLPPLPVFAPPAPPPPGRVPAPVYVPMPPPVMPAAPTILPEAQRASAETALLFAQAYQPADFVTEVAVDAAVSTFRSESAQQPNSAAIEQQYPGAGKRMEQTLAKVVAAVYARELPKSQRAIADVARSYFTEAELRDVTAFYKSPAGSATLRAVVSTADLKKIGDPTDANGDPNLTGKDLVRAVSNASFLGRMSEADVSALSRFSTSPAGRKLMRISPLLAEEVARQTNAIIVNGRPDVDEAMMLTVREVMAGKPRK